MSRVSILYEKKTSSTYAATSLKVPESGRWAITGCAVPSGAAEINVDRP